MVEAADVIGQCLRDLGESMHFTLALSCAMCLGIGDGRAPERVRELGQAIGHRRCLPWIPQEGVEVGCHASRSGDPREPHAGAGSQGLPAQRVEDLSAFG